MLMLYVVKHVPYIFYELHPRASKCCHQIFPWALILHQVDAIKPPVQMLGAKEQKRKTWSMLLNFAHLCAIFNHVLKTVHKILNAFG